jgi:hypothetical protein
MYVDRSGLMALGELSAATNIVGSFGSSPSSLGPGNFFNVVKDSSDPFYQYHSLKFKRYGGDLPPPAVPVITDKVRS